VDVLASLSREEWKLVPLSSQMLVETSEKLKILTKFEFDAIISNLDQANQKMIYIDGFFNMMLLILQDIMSYIGRLPSPVLVLNYRVNQSRLEVTATFPPLAGPGAPLPIRRQLPEYVVDAFGGTLNCRQSPQQWQVSWTFPLDE
jgi:hypothetical protein